MDITNLKKTELVREVAKKTDWTINNSLQAVNAVFEAVSEQLLDGKSVTINGIGKFEPKVKPAHLGINMAQKDENGKLFRDENGELVKTMIPARYNIKFKFSESFKTKVRNVSVE